MKKIVQSEVTRITPFVGPRAPVGELVLNVITDHSVKYAIIYGSLNLRHDMLIFFAESKSCYEKYVFLNSMPVFTRLSESLVVEPEGGVGCNDSLLHLRIADDQNGPSIRRIVVLGLLEWLVSKIAMQVHDLELSINSFTKISPGRPKICREGAPNVPFAIDDVIEDTIKIQGEVVD